MSATEMLASAGIVSLLKLDPGCYEPHPLHGSDRTYLETNCYTDIVIELLHARGHEPLAAMGCVLRSDFEGDQWSFFKPAERDLELLYGIDIHEMQPYRALPIQIAEQILSDRTLIVELDSFYLPDTAATSYHSEHVKSSVVAEAIDIDAKRLRYFHGRGYFELSGTDYDGVFRLGRELPADVLPPYTELVRFDAGSPLKGSELRATAHELMRDHLAHRPRANPFVAFASHLERDVPLLLEGDLADYHAYAFATVRMVGSAFEVGASYVDWQLGEAGTDAALAMREIVEGCKLLSFKLARRRAFDPSQATTGLIESWERAISALEDATA